MNPFEQAYSFLQSVHPQLPWVTLAVSALVACNLVRRYAPTWWVLVTHFVPEHKALSHAIQAWPAVVIPAVLGALGTGDPIGAAWGALAGLVAPFAHHLLKRLPGPYKGALGAAVDGPTSRRMLVGLPPPEEPVAAYVTITVNGYAHLVNQLVSYESIAHLSGISNPTVRWYDDRGAGFLRPGQTLLARTSTHFTVLKNPEAS